MTKSERPTRETVELSPMEVSHLLRLPEEDGAVLTGSLMRLPAAWVRERESRLGPLDLSFSDCALLTGLPIRQFHRWRAKGLIQVRVLSMSRTEGLRVAPAELVRVLRHIAQERNGTIALVETPAQMRKRAAATKEAARRACYGSG